MTAVLAAVGALAGGALIIDVILARFAAPRRDDDGPLARSLDRAAMIVVAALALAVAVSWALALLHVLTPIALVSCALVALLASAGFFAKRTLRIGGVQIHVATSTLVLTIIVLLPVVTWIVFAGWRGSVLPVYNHDGLSYHFPKAVLLMKEAGFTVFDVHEGRTASWPVNYELLLADTMMLTGGDSATAIIAPLSYALFLLFAARTAATWWGDGVHVLVVTVLAAATPIAILHSGLHKNDLLFSSFSLAAFSWAARWKARGCVASLMLSVVAVLLCVGTKASGAFTCVATAPALLLGLRRQTPMRWRAVAFGVALSLVGAVLLGVWVYVANFRAFGRLILPPDFENAPAGYGDVANVWHFTVLALLKPFSRPDAVWNPWRGQYWWWPSNDIWFSHFGAVFSVAAVLLLPCFLMFRRSGDREERTSTSLAALVAYMLTLPVHVAPVGFFAGYGRYVLFVVPVVLAWTVSPIMVWLASRPERWRTASAVTACAGALVLFGDAARAYGLDDSYAPLDYVNFQLGHEDNRVPFVRQNRAASVFDRLARPDDVCAVDFSQDTWVYPAYGRGWTRQVQYLPRTAGPVTIDPRVDWVIVDRSWNVFFGHPGFTDMGQVRFLGRGQPSAADLKVLRQMTSDPAFELVYSDPSQNQALFRRRLHGQ